jgi:RimJ/RimL family protein N-acetyltransferase
MKVFLETDRLILRQFTADDVELLVQLDSDPKVMKYLTGGSPTPRDVLEFDHIPAYLEYHEKYKGYGFWVALEKSTGEFIGWFHFRPNEGAPEDEPELGYRLIRSAWGKGYATEGSRALIRRGFEELGVRRVVASTMAVNTGSRRVMEKSGLKLARTFVMDWPETIEGSEHGEVEYAITREEWEIQEAASQQPPAAG